MESERICSLCKKPADYIRDGVCDDCILDRTNKALNNTAVKAREKLGLDSCIIIATVPDCLDKDGDPVTFVTTGGSGNFYAQYGSVKRWVLAYEKELTKGGDSD